MILNPSTEGKACSTHSPREEGALFAGGVRHGAGRAKVDGDRVGARLSEPLHRAAATHVARLPQPLRARRHRSIEHRQHLRARPSKRSARRLRSPLPRTLPASLPIDTSVSIGMMTTSGLVAGFYCGGECVRARSGKAGEGSGLIHTEPRDPRPTCRGQSPAAAHSSGAESGEDKDKRVNTNSLFLLD